MSLLHKLRPSPLARGPKILMFDGVDPRKDATPEKARYWKSLGVDGFFLNNLVPAWNNRADAAAVEAAKRFQKVYAAAGVTENFLKVAIYVPHDFSDQAAGDRVVENFRRAASLARAAGLRGIALDLEPYVDRATFWAEAGRPGRREAVRALGEAIGRAIREGFPRGILVLLPETVAWADREEPEPQATANGIRYNLSRDFADGLLRANFPRVVVALEGTYDDPDPAETARRVEAAYRERVKRARPRGASGTAIYAAPGIWPLGRTYEDKSPRIPAGEFARRLRRALSHRTPYVWIYGHGSAWESRGPYGASPASPELPAFTRALRSRGEAVAGEVRLAGFSGIDLEPAGEYVLGEGWHRTGPDVHWRGTPISQQQWQWWRDVPGTLTKEVEPFLMDERELLRRSRGGDG